MKEMFYLLSIIYSPSYVSYLIDDMEDIELENDDYLMDAFE